MAGAPPDMDITAYDKERKTGAKVGVGWTQDDGSINLVLNPGTALIYHPNVSYKVKKKVVDEAPAYGSFKPTRYGFTPPARAPVKPANMDDLEDDVPF